MGYLGDIFEVSGRSEKCRSLGLAAASRQVKLTGYDTSHAVSKILSFFVPNPFTNNLIQHRYIR